MKTEEHLNRSKKSYKVQYKSETLGLSGGQRVAFIAAVRTIENVWDETVTCHTELLNS